MIEARALIGLFEQALKEKWGYIYGAAGEVWTQAAQDAAGREMTVRYGQKWVGRHVADCSGLFTWAFKKLGGTCYHGSNTMFHKYTTRTGTLTDGKPADGCTLHPAAAVFKYNKKDGYHHVGLYIGGDTVIEAKGTAYGVVTSSLKDGWTHFGELKGVHYADEEEESMAEESILYQARVTTVSGSLNVRKGPGATYAVIGTLKKDSTAEVLAQQEEWLRVRQGTLCGWCSANYLTRIQEGAVRMVIIDSEGNRFEPQGTFSVRIESITA